MNDKYLQFDYLDFAQDQSFIFWVQNKTDQKEAKAWERFFEENPTLADKRNKAKKLINSIQFKKEKDAASVKKKLWENIDNQSIDAPKAAKTFSLRRYFLPISIAASLALLVFVYFANTQNEVIRASQESIAHVLPDQSKIEMNEDSKISYSKSFAKNRKVKLNGEAFFNVKRGSVFSVVSEQAIVEVLGTSFNIYDRNGQYELECYSGKVRVSSKELNYSETITKGEKIYLKNGTFEKMEELIPSKNPGWVSEDFDYYNSSLDRVFYEMEKHFNVDIQLENPAISILKYTGNMDKTDLSAALYSVCWPMKLKYEIKGNIVRIK